MSRIITGMLPPAKHCLLPTLCGLHDAVTQAGLQMSDVEWIVLPPRTCSDLAKDMYGKWHSTDAEEVKHLMAITKSLEDGPEVKPSRALVERWYILVVRTIH